MLLELRAGTRNWLRPVAALSLDRWRQLFLDCRWEIAFWQISRDLGFGADTNIPLIPLPLNGPLAFAFTFALPRRKRSTGRCCLSIASGRCYEPLSPISHR